MTITPSLALIIYLIIFAVIVAISVKAKIRWLSAFALAAAISILILYIICPPVSALLPTKEKSFMPGTITGNIYIFIMFATPIFLLMYVVYKAICDRKLDTNGKKEENK